MAAAAVLGQRGACCAYGAAAGTAESGGTEIIAYHHISTVSASLVSRSTEDLASGRRARLRRTWLASPRCKDLPSSTNYVISGHDRLALDSCSSTTSPSPSFRITAAAAAAAADGAGAEDTAVATPPPLPESGGDSAGGGEHAQLVDESHTLTLDGIRNTLIRLEDSIIFHLIERAQYKWNLPTYDARMISVPPHNLSLLAFLLRETERLHSNVRRYTSPDEHPFFPDAIERPLLPPLLYPKVLCAGSGVVNVNPAIWKMYIEWLVPQLTEEGDDKNYGSAATCDVLCLQALSRRIHYGKFVAEAKCREAMEEYDRLIYNKDREGIIKKLTVEAVEDAVVRRVELKARTFGQDILESGVAAACDSEEPRKIDPKIVARLYQDGIMPLTKEVEVEYLLRRLDFPSTP
ncbi:hypothetical protein CBR_g36499 [Chara braunii]|uniref:chorismate mutase n=1 Tax=Chara braunii TaxID=69332 RepID=A0A388LL60_CHABU|nr:hypothetical protein CBR_g36499 [Chara braunii]|eukprot:GBG82973.1 hypothetical protein CBR_g36499 [Chara braunii]